MSGPKIVPKDEQPYSPYAERQGDDITIPFEGQTVTVDTGTGKMTVSERGDPDATAGRTYETVAEALGTELPDTSKADLDLDI